MTSEGVRHGHLGLRAKLVIAFGGVLLITLAVAIGGIVWSARLGRSIQVILSENFRSVVAAQEMKEALERMDSGALFSLTGDPAQGRTLVETNGPRFEEALEAQLSNLTLPGEKDRTDRITVLYGRFQESLEGVLDTGRSLELRRSIYYGELLPRFQEIKRLADEILDLNQANMTEASVRARYLATTARDQMILALGAGIALAAFCVAFLSRTILRPLAALTDSVRRIERGDFGPVTEPKSDDEIGQLTEAFNAMARRLEALRRSDRARLQVAQQISQLTIDSLPDPVIVLDPDHGVELANREARSLLGIVPGGPLPAEHEEWIASLVLEASRSGEVESRGSYERALQLFVEGRERFLLPQAVAIRDRQGVVGVTLILVDVTELRRLDAMKSNLVSTVSHELMTPLTSLSMALHILLGERLGALSPEQEEMLVSARQDADRLQQILDGLLGVSRLESGAADLELSALTLHQLVAQAVEPLRSAFEAKNVELRIELPDPEVPVQADQVLAGVLLGNLLSNALKHTGSGGRVRIGARPVDGEKEEISVSDSGPGIPAEYRDRVFDRFFRGPGQKERGAGLGLAIAQEIAEAHGGRLWLDVESGPGAVFRFELQRSAT